MGDTRRKQFHSCDPCRKGRRGCDATKQVDRVSNSCSNCKRWKKECTFNWLSKHAESKGRKRSRPTAPSASSPSTASSSSSGLALPEVYWHSADTTGMVNPPFAPLLQPSDAIVDGVQAEWPNEGQFALSSWGMTTPCDWPEPPAVFHEPLTNYLSDPFGIPQLDTSFTSSSGFPDPGSNPRDEDSERRSKRHDPGSLRMDSENTARQYARSMMTKNLIRIYHDSMENALSCWLTEHNCPYSDSIGDLRPYKKRDEWGPNWSNRMCIRVCRLDRASSKCGISLTPEEDRTAARALHLAIIAFASQWTQHAQKGTGLSVPAEFASDERLIRQRVWNEARHALEQSSGIPSFRIAFANIIFSLTQRPLDDRQDKRLDQLLENDRAPIFLDNANRQLFTFRHKFTRIQRESVTKLRRGSAGTTPTKMGPPDPPSSSQIDPIMTSHEHRGTLNLLHWLGVMFDTLSAAMYQRPLVVSDEDSQVALVPTPMSGPKEHVNSGIQPISHNETNQWDIWGQFFLRSGDKVGSAHTPPRWPCSYEQAASVLSEATPVKVLLYRRITQLQTLIYRGASRDCLEDAIQNTILVYQHWNCTYRWFMLDCVANHEMLPPRIQSWYVILDGHWHLATMLLADVIESIDDGNRGSDVKREARQATDLVSTLRIDNALAVGALARSSLQGQEPTLHRHFHDSLNEVAFLVEPWTVVLIHSFAKAAYICLDSLDSFGNRNLLADCFRQNCEFCICALQYLGRKSDMAFLVAQNLSKSLSMKFRPSADSSALGLSTSFQESSLDLLDMVPRALV